MEQNESKTDVSSEEIEDILENYKTVAVVGLSQRRIAPVTRWHLTYNRKGSGLFPYLL